MSFLTWQWTSLSSVLSCVFFFFHERVGYNFEDAMSVTGLEHVPDGQSIRRGLTENNVRNKVADYFLTDAGALLWQT
jgi:hypothetical protein